KSWPYLVAAAVIDSPGRAVPAVLVLARPFDEGVARELAARSAGPLVLSAGRTTLLAVGEGKEQLQLIAERGEGAQLFAQDGHWAAASQELAPGLALWTMSTASGHAADDTSATLVATLVLWPLCGAA